MLLPAHLQILWPFQSEARVGRRAYSKKCPYCRHPAPTSQMEARMMFRKMEGTAGIRNNPFAVARIGLNRFEEGDYRGAFKHWTKAAGMGDVQSHHYLSIVYHLELGVEQDKEREVYHLEQAAIAGHAPARFNLGCHELKEGNVERAVKHFTIAAKQGNDESLSNLSTLSQHGIDVGDFDAIVRAYSSVHTKAFAAHLRRQSRQQSSSPTQAGPNSAPPWIKFTLF